MTSSINNRTEEGGGLSALNSHFGLVLTADNLFYKPQDPVHFEDFLQAAGIIEKKLIVPKSLDHQHHGYMVGKEFLTLITFLGCSPAIEVTPPEEPHKWGNFCYIELRPCSQAIFFPGMSRLKSICPHCRTRIDMTGKDLSHWQPKKLFRQCPKCQNHIPAERIDYKHTAGFGSFFIIIHSVYPHEAVPTDKLMQVLHKETSQIWDYFYFER